MEELLKENRRRKRDVEGGNHEQSKKKRKWTSVIFNTRSGVPGAFKCTW
jgi:hypothetical protein